MSIRGFATLGEPTPELTPGEPTPGRTRSGALEFPDDLRAVLGDAAVGSATLRRGTFHLVVDRVDPAALRAWRIVAVVDGIRVPLKVRGTVLTASLPDVAAPPRSLIFEVRPADEA